MARRKCFFSLTLILLLVVAHPLLAQPALTQQVQVAGGSLTLTVSYPDGWFGTSYQDEVLIASSAAALDELKSTGVVKTAGETGIGAYLPSFLDNVKLAHDTPAKEAVEGFLSAAKLTGSVQASADYSVPAATVTLTAPGTDTKSLIGALAFPEGTVIFGVIPASKLDATAKAIINSIVLTSPLGIPEVTPDASVDLTPAVFNVRDQLINFSLSTGLPDGWVSEYKNDGFVYLANSQTALEKTNAANPVYAPSEVSLSILLPPVVPKLGMPRDGKPEDAISTFEANTNAQGKVETDDTFDVPAAHAALSGGNLPVGGGDIFALKFDKSLVVLVVQPSGVIDGTIMAILHSIQYAPADQSAATVVATAAPTATTAATQMATKELRQWAVYADGTSEYGSDDWSFMQASGAPNTPTCGDNTTAWASETSVGKDVLRVAFSQPVIASQINIHQSYNPGAIVEVDVGNSTNPSKVLPLPNSADPVGNTDCPGVFTIPVIGVDTPIDFVVIYLDQSRTNDWNEIDAVELVGAPVS